ncbi:hypothetical protein A2V94_07145 [Candidatus Atribacteria bacterium RBG_16_35_8]|nr:MAG: hypothetical protein A2V94_07145 [Candidatus Atribacteria bacterium RBG_16_35_8]
MSKTKNEKKLIDCLYKWWASKRPILWDIDQHLENPSINTVSSSEKAIALAFSKFLLENKVFLARCKKVTRGKKLIL